MVGFETHIFKFDALSTLSYCASMCTVNRMKTNRRLHNKKSIKLIHMLALWSWWQVLQRI